MVEQEAQRGRVRRLEHRRRQPVDDDQDDGLGAGARTTVSRARACGARRSARASGVRSLSASAGHRDRLEEAEDRNERERRRGDRADPDEQARRRRACRRAAAHRVATGAVPKRAGDAADCAGDGLGPGEHGERRSRLPPTAADRGRGGPAQDDPAANMPSATPIPASTPIQYQVPIRLECTPSGPPGPLPDSR